MSRQIVEQGAAALIVVIFSVLLLITVSLGFMRLVATDQQRTINDELARGAYDAAIAGVEDGKRVLQACMSSRSAAACTAIADNRCNTVQASTILSADPNFANAKEVLMQNSTGIDGGFDQAYTCVRINRNTSDLEGTLATDLSRIIPLTTVGPFTEITISWYRRPISGTVYLPGLLTDTGLPAASNWAAVGQVRPPLLRVQLIQYQDGNFTLDHFDQSGGGNTIYLYPKSVGLDATGFASDSRHTTTTDELLKAVRCNGSVLPGEFVCSVRVSLPNPVGATDGANRQAYLRLTSIYGEGTDYNIRAEGTQFYDVSPAIDSTGRASDVFRRVRARVELVSPQDQSLYPRATVDITRNFCKNFSVSADTYIDGTCKFNQP